MNVYKIKTDCVSYTVVAKDFGSAVRLSDKILAKEKALYYGEDEVPAVHSIIEDDNVTKI